MNKTISHYDVMIAKAAGRLEEKMRAAPWGVRTYVWAIPTQGPDKPGSIAVLYDNEPDPERGVIVRPMQADKWEAVPYSRQASALWEAMRREPILPIE